MKANELMIGDWVHVTPISRKVNAHDDRVLSIRKEYGNGHYNIEGNYKEKGEESNNTPNWFAWSVGESNIEPIPPTEEILKANGWERLQGTDDLWRYRSALYLVKQYKGYSLREGKSYCIDHICYVHELQHALRLCGLNDLADNFRLE